MVGQELQTRVPRVGLPSRSNERRRFSRIVSCILMDFGLTDEQRMILQTVREFVQKEVAPLLPEVQKAEIRGERFPDRSTIRGLQAKARTAGLWGLQTPEDYGGANLGSVMNALI